MNIDPEVVNVGIPSFVQYDVAMEVARQADDREVGRHACNGLVGVRIDCTNHE